MLCEKCHNAEATVHMTQIINGKKTEEHLCAKCANAAGYDWYNGWSQSWPQIGNFGFENLFPFYAPNLEADNPICPLCKTSYQQFLSSGRLGCSQCYNTFGDRLKPTIQKIHGSIHHLGKAPSSFTRPAKSRFENIRNKGTKKDKLQAELNKLIAEERFEEAALVRDEIKALEAKDQGAN